MSRPWIREMGAGGELGVRAGGSDYHMCFMESVYLVSCKRPVRGSSLVSARDAQFGYVTT